MGTKTPAPSSVITGIGLEWRQLVSCFIAIRRYKNDLYIHKRQAHERVRRVLRTHGEFLVIGARSLNTKDKMSSESENTTTTTILRWSHYRSKQMAKVHASDNLQAHGYQNKIISLCFFIKGLYRAASWPWSMWEGDSRCRTHKK